MIYKACRSSLKLIGSARVDQNGCMLAVDNNSGPVSFFSILSGSGLLDVKNDLGNIIAKHASVINNKVKLK